MQCEHRSGGDHTCNDSADYWVYTDIMFVGGEKALCRHHTQAFLAGATEDNSVKHLEPITHPRYQ